MAKLKTEHVKITGMAACVPSNVEENLYLPFFKEGEAEKVIASTGIERRRIADKNTTSSDLCCKAAEKLIDELHWEKEEIDCLIFVSQSPDYIQPATSCLLQKRLGLSINCFSMDISYGCPGWVYGLSVISSLLSHGTMKKGLLLVGDTPSKCKSRNDKTTWPLFGDAGTATALEFTEEHSEMYFTFATEGSTAIIIKDGGARNPVTSTSLEEVFYDEGISRRPLDSEMDGMAVFTFGLKRAPESVQNLLDYTNIDKDDIDLFIFHQANLFMNEKIRKKLNIPEEKVPYSMQNYGNTTCATIPLTLVSQCEKELSENRKKIIATAFGVGLSWGSVLFEVDRIICLAVMDY